MKWHRPLINAVVENLHSILLEGRPADKVIEKSLKTHQFGSRDRRFIAENTYEVVRWWRYFFYLNTQVEKTSLTSNDELWMVLGVCLQKKGLEVPDWPEFQKVLKVFFKFPPPRAISESIPDWLDTMGEQELGSSEWPLILKALNQSPPVVLRCNTLKISVIDLQKVLKEEGVQTSQHEDLLEGLLLTERINVFTTQAFKKGFFEMQDGASQQVAHWLGPQPGERIIDACAGAGGKTLHLAALTKNKGKIIAMDVEARKLEELKRRCQRAGVDVVESRLIEGSKTIKRLQQSADALLLDVPCSGLGVLRRNPDSKWKLTPERLQHLKELQGFVLSYSSMVRPGGRMVYATCSVLPSENELQVQHFLNENKSWALIQEKHIWPHKTPFDGFYMALLRREK